MDKSYIFSKDIISYGRYGECQIINSRVPSWLESSVLLIHYLLFVLETSEQSSFRQVTLIDIVFFILC